MAAVYEIDQPAVAVYESIVDLLPEVRALLVREYKKPPPYEERVRGQTAANDLLLRARNLRRSKGLPFWDAIVLEVIAEGSIDDWLLEGLLFHQEPIGNALEISRDNIKTDGIVTLVERARVSYPWALLSEVICANGMRKHLPMLDFRCEISHLNLQSVTTIAHRLLSCPWTVIESERSYHLVGADLLTFRDLAAFFGRALLLGPIVDRHYIAHQLLNGGAALRIISDSTKPGLRARLTTFPYIAGGG
jgi:hypothetical protein